MSAAPRIPGAARRLRVLLAALLGVVALSAGTATSASAERAAAREGSSDVGGFLDVGPASACAVQRDRVVRCWGKGSSGALGTGAIDDRLASPGSAASIVPLSTVSQVAVGDLHACALQTGGSVRCWGQGASGQLGGSERDNRLDGYADPRTGTDDATAVQLGAPVAGLTAGGSFTCAVLTNGAVRCWGSGLFGRLGSRATDNRLDGLVEGGTDDASTVPLPGAAVAVTAGDMHACALLGDGSVHCWGYGANGRLGSNAADDRLDGVVDPASGTDEASTVPLGGPATAISAGGAHTCALMATGDVRCWGLGTNGQLGDGRNWQSLMDVPGEQATTVPIKPVGTAQNMVSKTANLKALAISAGDAFTCAVMENGDVRCWGAGDHGQLGQSATDGRLDNNATAPSDAATRVGGGTDGKGAGLGAPAVAISAGSGSACAELNTGAIRCWGSGDSGRLGSSATDRRLDGVVDPSTGTDDASIVPVGGLPQSATDGIVPATPTPAPTPAVAPQLPFTLSVKKRKLKLTATLQPTKAGKCPKTVGLSVKVGKSTLAKRTLRVTKKGTTCRTSTTVTLAHTVKKGKTVAVRLAGKGLTARSLSATGA